MLPPNFLEDIENQAINLYSSLELEIIEEISKRIVNVGYANTVVHNDVLIAQEMGLLYQDIISLVSKNTEKSYEEIQKIFENAGIETLKFDDKIYKEAGLNPIPIKQSKSMLQFLTSTANKTNSNLKNLCMTTANISQQEFINAIDKAYLEVSTGVKSYSSSIIDTIQELSKTSSKVEYPSGYKTSIENAVRMNIITGVNQTCGKLQEMRADEMGWDLMELTAHGGARPEHAEWQGKIVSRSGRKGYLSLDDIGYGEPTGFKGVNCRHDWYPYFKGSSRTYTDEQLNNWKNETVTYNGQKISKYNASQIQRRMERQIRQDKKDIAGLQGILTSKNKDDKILEEAKQKLQSKQIKLNEHNSILNDFVKQTNSKKDNSRLYVGKTTIKENKNKTIKSAKSFKVQQKDILLSNFNKYENIDVSELTPEQRSLVINYKMYKMGMGDEYLKLAQKSNVKITELENIKNRKSDYFDITFESKYKKAKQYTTEQSDALTKVYQSNLNKLNKEQKSSIADYTGIDFDDINRSLRAERKLSERLSKNIDNITDALNNSITVEDMIVHRHVEFDGASKFTGLKEYQLKDNSIEELNKLLKGKECTDKAFISTSIRNFKDELREVVYDIYIPKGTKGLYINELSTSYKDIEYEFLLQRETKFKIQEIFKDTDGTLKIVMEVIGNGI